MPGDCFKSPSFGAIVTRYDNRPRPEDLRDLCDLCEKWDDVRAVAEQVKAERCLSQDERAIVGWLILLADRVFQDRPLEL